MRKFETTAGPGFPAFRTSVTIIELLLAVAAAGLTATIWLSVAGWTLSQDAPARQEVAAEPGPAIQVTLPPVVIVGHRERPARTRVASTEPASDGFADKLRQ